MRNILQLLALGGVDHFHSHVGYLVFSRDLHLGKGTGNALGEIADLSDENPVADDFKNNICKAEAHKLVLLSKFFAEHNIPII